MYAFGVMMNELIAKDAPFSGQGVGDIRNSVLSGGRPEIPLSMPRVLQVHDLANSGGVG